MEHASIYSNPLLNRFWFNFILGGMPRFHTPQLGDPSRAHLRYRSPAGCHPLNPNLFILLLVIFPLLLPNCGKHPHVDWYLLVNQHSYGKLFIYSWFTMIYPLKLWFPIAMLAYWRVISKISLSLASSAGNASPCTGLLSFSDARSDIGPRFSWHSDVL